METGEQPQLDNLILGEIQVPLSEKRTALAFMRTGIAIFALPLSVLSVLIATSRYYSFEKVMPLLMPLLLLNVGSGRARHLADLHFDQALSSLRSPDPRAHPEYRSLAKFVE
jgi:hypothetical protein